MFLCNAFHTFFSVGYYIQPTVIETTRTDDRVFNEEIFGPIVAAYVYPDSETKNMLQHVIKDTPYALTGALYSQDQ
jgi:1-pyrroline-5-carboxylate dehydrogenase